MKRDLESLAAGEMTFDTFARRTEKLWASIAKKLRARYRDAFFVTEDDLVQLILVEVWERVNPTGRKAFDPTRAVTLEQYVLFHAHDRAKKYLIQQSRKKRGTGVLVFVDDPYSGGQAQEVDDGFERYEDYDDAVTRYRSLMRRVPERHLPGLAALCLEDGNRTLAGQRLYRDAWARKQLGVKSARHGVALVRHAALVAKKLV